MIGTGRARLGCLLVVVAALGVPSVSRADGFRKGPYLQNVTLDAITVMFQTSEPTSAIVTFGPTKEYGRSVASGRKRLHEVRLEGLQPSTIYHYQVVAGGARSPDRRFSTAATTDEPFRFLVYGDNRDGDDAHARVVESMRTDDPDMVVNTGDMVGNGSSEADWQVFFDIEQSMIAETPIYPVIGNHEVFGSRGRALFRRYFSLPEDSLFPEQDYSFSFGNARFIVLTAYQNFPRGQLQWLREQLEDAQSDPAVRHRFVFLHHGPYSSGYHGDNRLAARAGLPGVLRDGEVDIVFSGHDHDYERGRTSGLNYVVSGGGGAPLYEVDSRRPGAEAFEATHHHVRVDVVGDGVELTSIRPDGSIIEQCGVVGATAWRCEAPQEPAALQKPRPSGPRPLAREGCGAEGVAIALPLVVLTLVGLYARVRRRA